METAPNDSISQVHTYIKLFEKKYKKPPNKVIVTSDTFMLLKSNSMLIPNQIILRDKSYSGYVLNNENKILNLEVHIKEKFSEKELAGLEEKLKEIKNPLILSNKKNNYYVCDMDLSDKELNKLLI